MTLGSFRLGRRMCFVLAAMSLAATALRADVIVRWSFNPGVVTTLGNTITGYFDVDFKTSLNSFVVSNWDITVSGHSDPTYPWHFEYGNEFAPSNSLVGTSSPGGMVLNGLGVADTRYVPGCNGLCGPYLIIHTAGLTPSGGLVFLEAYPDILWEPGTIDPSTYPGLYNMGHQGDDWRTWGWATGVVSGSLTGIPEPVPEPATLLLLGSGLLSLAGLGGRRLFRKA